MPNTLLVSFIGVGKPGIRGSETAYAQTRYKFSGERIYETCIFGSALRQFLIDTHNTIKRWLIMGSEDSIWPALYEITDATDDVIDAWTQISEAYDNREINQKKLDIWAKALSEHLANMQNIETEIILKLTGVGETEESQMAIINSIIEASKDCKSIELDISHGLRHQPVIASSAAFMLKQTKQIYDVNFYNGAYELRDRSLPKKEQASPVVELSIVKDVLDAGIALSEYEHTGSIKPLTDKLKLKKEEKEIIDELLYLEEINQPTKKIQAVFKIVSEYDSKSPWDEFITKKITKKLNYGKEEYLWKRMLSRAEKELKYERYLHAIVLTFEALLVKIVLVKELTGKFPRGEARDLVNKGGLCWENGINNFLRNFGFLRNTVAHGDQPMNGYVAKSIQTPKNLEKEITKGIKVVRDIFEDEVAQKK